MITNIEKKEKLEKMEEAKKEQAKQELMSDAISRLYKNKKQFDNSKNTKH